MLPAPDRDRLLDLVAATVHRGTVTLASGARSDFYLDGRLVTLTPEGSHLLARATLELARRLGATALAGPTTGACPLVSAAGALAWERGLSLALAYVRAQAKGHGLQKAVEGPPLTRADRVLVLDDVLTSGGSLLAAIDRLRDATGATVLGALVIVDRQAGGRAALAGRGVDLHALFTREEVEGRMNRAAGG